MMKMKRMIRYIFMLLATFFANNMIAQVTLNLHPNATNGIDALIDNSSATTNYGTSPDLAAWAWTSGGITIARGLLKFDLSSIPSNAIITSATLSLYCNTASSVTQLNSGANACLLQRITSTWTESGVTWNNQPTTTTVNQDTLAQSTSTTQNYPSIDVRNLVIDMINNPSTSYGFMMKLITESTYRSMVLSSSDNSDSTKWPRLVIVYSTASNGLVAYYPFNGNAGDSSGFGNHGTVYGATLTTGRNGISNTAYYFDGTSNKITVSASASIQPQYKLTLAAWIQPDAKSSAGWATVLTKRYSPGTDPYNSYALSTYNNDKWEFDLSNGTTGSQKTAKAHTSTPYNAGWIFLSATYDSTQAKLYVNGVLDTTISFTGSIGYSTNDLVIGYTTSGVNDYYKGRIDEIRVYNRDLSQAEILQLYSPYSNNYYSKSTGSLDSLSTWGPNTNGTGTSPTSFGANNTIYNVVNNSSPTISSNWYITGTNTAVVFGDGTNTLNTSIPSGLTFGADSIYVRNNVTYTVLGTLITNKPGFENGSTVQYTASGTQNILPATFYNLVVSGATKSLVSNTTIKGTLAILANINCGTNTLTIGTSATQTGSITYGSGIITGNLSRWFSASTNSGSTGLFPIGTSSIYRPIQIEYTSSPSSGGILTAIFTPTNPGSSGLNPALTDFSISPIVSVNKAGPNGYWTITPSSGISGGTYTTTVTGTGFYGISSVTGLRLLRRSSSSSSWALTGSAVTPTGTTTIPVVSRTSITSIGGDFGIGADSSVNPLPIIITEFEAKLISKNNVQLNWITSSEINNNYFEVERSVDGSQFTAIGKVDGNGTTNSISSYQFTDHSLSSVNREQSTIYYRLKQVDFDGRFDFSKTVSVNINSLQQPISIYPNPSDGNFIIENDLAQNSNITLSIINLLGEKVWSNFYQLQAGKNSIEVKATTLSPGIYFLRIEDESRQINEVRKVLLK